MNLITPSKLIRFSQTLIAMENTGKSSISTDRKTCEKTVDSSSSAKPNGKSTASSVTVDSSASVKSNEKSTASSAILKKPNKKAAVSSANPMYPTAATALSSAHGDQVMLFRDNCLIEGTVVQGFVPFRRVGTFDLIAGSLYKLSNFFGSRSKDQYRVTVSFTWNSSLSVLENPPVLIPEDKFRFHSYEEFKANCDSKGDLYDYVGHMKLVNGQTITDHMVLDEDAIAEKQHLCVHVQTHDGPVMKLYLWDKVAADFCHIPSVLLVTTVNPKHLGETFAITSSSSRVFMDADVQPTKDYLEWLSSNSDIANRIAAEVVTKHETVTLEELFSYIKQEASKVAWFECMATIDDVGSAWYYISCDGCNNKAVKGPTSLICNNKKCGKSEVTGVPQYLTRISVYDKSEQAVFVILGDAGKELTGKHAAELVAKYFEANDGVGAEHCVPVPQALLDTIGQTRKFVVKVSDHNLKGKTQSITVTKILPLEAPLPSAVGEESGSSGGLGDTAGDRARKAAEILESDAAKRSKSG
ncbi:LOW QUALITY PROTEIN: hypothetical protein HID58_053339 [Brassica napus]|uniref:Replication factor A C-terminal domain-containing protein n=1 Tax=Brassica napus TaxID=3708 RepID=A0ABQ8AEF9_BRANA|nr:LOW QUALITY PROTEIN: hypothetical protein HID58_053339 [Brassica napus]